eukprot:m.559834 g.559834  ORF g.559834 m.559834 type:complete len:642 (+) comp57781_c0_seq3:539-2464(+)
MSGFWKRLTGKKSASFSQSSGKEGTSSSARATTASTSSLPRAQSDAGVGTSVPATAIRVQSKSSDLQDPSQATAKKGSIVYGAEAWETQTWESTVKDKRKIDALLARERQRQQVLFEVIQTEQIYLRDLIVIKNLFREALLREKCVGKHEIVALFSNLDEIISVNGELCERLLARREDGIVSEVADIFIDMFERRCFEAYKEFCVNQIPASELYLQLKQSNSKFAEVMGKCDSNTAESKGFNLPSFLLKGMQRLLKYGPLLGQVLKFTKESNTKDRELTQRAILAVDKFANEVNELVRAADNARRFPIICSQLVRETSITSWIGRKDIDLNLASDPTRKLLSEGRLDFIGRPSLTSSDKKVTEAHVFLFTDMLLITFEREGKYLVKDFKEHNPAIYLHTITDIHAEITPGTKERTTLVIAVGAREMEFQPAPTAHTLRDCPRPIVRTPATKIIKFLCQAQQTLKMWMSTIIRARDDHIRFLDESRRGAMSSVSDFLFEEHAVTLLVSTRINTDSDTDSVDFARMSSASSTWEISFSGEATPSGKQCFDAKRVVRLVQGLDGLGLTLVGKNPVLVQEVEEDGPAFAAGVLAGDAILAVNSTPCFEFNHDQVVELIRQGLRTSVPSAPMGRKFAVIADTSEYL